MNIPQINGVHSDQCHGNKDNQVATSFSSHTYRIYFFLKHLSGPES